MVVFILVNVETAEEKLSWGEYLHDLYVADILKLHF